MTTASTTDRAALVSAISAGSPGTKYGVVNQARWSAEWIAATCMRWMASSGESGPLVTICAAMSPPSMRGIIRSIDSSTIWRMLSPVA